MRARFVVAFVLAAAVVGILEPQDDAWSLDATRPTVTARSSDYGRILFDGSNFVTLGAAFAPLIGLGDIGRGIVLTLITVFALRPLVASACLIGSRLDASDRALVSLGRSQGCGPTSPRRVPDAR